MPQNKAVVLQGACLVQYNTHFIALSISHANVPNFLYDLLQQKLLLKDKSTVTC